MTRCEDCGGYHECALVVANCYSDQLAKVMADRDRLAEEVKKLEDERGRMQAFEIEKYRDLLDKHDRWREAMAEMPCGNKKCKRIALGPLEYVDCGTCFPCQARKEKG